MKATMFTGLFSLVLATAFCQTKTDTSKFNFNLEQKAINGTLPKDWFIWGKGYDASIDNTVVHEGRNSIAICSTEKRTSNSYGSIYYDIPANYEGKEIELKGYMKFDGVRDGYVGLMLSVLNSMTSLGYNDMKQENIQGTSDWTQYTVKLPFPKNAKTISIGAVLTGTGKVWVDDFQLLIDNEDISNIKPKLLCKAESDKEFDNGSKIDKINLSVEKNGDLKLLGLVWGFLKYYHPNIAKGDFNWDYELFRILPKFTEAKNSQQRDKLLSEWIKSLGDFETSTTEVKLEGESRIVPDLNWITNSNLSNDLVSQLLKVKAAKRKNENYYISFTEGAGNPIFNEASYEGMKFPDAGFRVLSLYRYWNIVQYFFPYKYLIGEDWKNVLKEFIPKFINASNEIEYKLVSLELIGRIHDTHADIWGQDSTLNKYKGSNYAPLEISFIEDKAVVTDFLSKKLGAKTDLQIGDVITYVNNKPVEEIVKEKLKYTPASNYPTQLRDIASDLLRTNDTTISIKYSRDGNIFSKEINAYSTNRVNIYKKYFKKDTCFSFINQNIGYLYLGTIKKGYLPKIMKEAENSKGLIVDLRCYPSDFVVFSLGEYLMPDSTEFVKFSNGSITVPGSLNISTKLKVGKKDKGYYKGKVMILVNETTQSQAEYTAMALRVAPNAKVIGSTTAGADGNMSYFLLPGGITTAFSGIGVYYPDGKETQRIGIVPDIVVNPTINGVKQNRDELIEKAVELINQ